MGLREAFLGIGQTDIAENVSAAFLDGNPSAFASGHQYVRA